MLELPIARPESRYDYHRVNAPHNVVAVLPEQGWEIAQAGGYPDCSDCDGRGEFMVAPRHRDIEPDIDTEECTTCRGTGFRVPSEDWRLVTVAGDVVQASRFDVADVPVVAA